MSSKLNLTEYTGGCDIIHLSFLSWRRERPGIGRGFELKSFFRIKCPTPGTS